MAKGTPGQDDTFTSPAEYRGAYTDLRDLIRLRYAAREITELTDNRTANPLADYSHQSFRVAVSTSRKSGFINPVMMSELLTGG